MSSAGKMKTEDGDFSEGQADFELVKIEDAPLLSSSSPSSSSDSFFHSFVKDDWVFVVHQCRLKNSQLKSKTLSKSLDRLALSPQITVHRRRSRSLEVPLKVNVTVKPFQQRKAPVLNDDLPVAVIGRHYGSGELFITPRNLRGICRGRIGLINRDTPIRSSLPTISLLGPQRVFARGRFMPILRRSNPGSYEFVPPPVSNLRKQLHYLNLHRTNISNNKPF